MIKHRLSASIDAELFSAADIALFMMVLFVQRLHGPGFDGFPSLAAWFARTAQRPAVAPAVYEIAAADLALSPALATWRPS